MSNRTLAIDDRLYAYLLQHSLREAPLLKRLRDETTRMPDGMMQIAPEQGQFMALLVELDRRQAGARDRHLHRLQLGLRRPRHGPGGAARLLRHQRGIHRRRPALLGRSRRRRPHRAASSAPALATLDGMLAAGAAGQLDFAFIDADKTNYDGYYERVLKLLRAGGLVAIDNMLWSGAVADPKDQRARHAGDPPAEREAACRRAGHREPGADRRRPAAGQKTLRIAQSCDKLGHRKARILPFLNLRFTPL